MDLVVQAALPFLVADRGMEEFGWVDRLPGLEFLREVDREDVTCHRGNLVCYSAGFGCLGKGRVGKDVDCHDLFDHTPISSGQSLGNCFGDDRFSLTRRTVMFSPRP